MKLICALLVLTLASFTLAAGKISYTYTLWIGDDAAEVYTIRLWAECKSKFISGMNQAAAKDPAFIYDGIEVPFGKFITEIGGHSQDPTK